MATNPASTETRIKSTTAEDTLQRKSRDASVVSGGHLVAKALKNEGVDTIFTLCGGHIIDIYDGCVDEGIRIIDVRHEQVAAHAADGYARQTGKLGCVVTTAGPGCTNAVTGIATAFRSESPVLHIGGQGRLPSTKWVRCRTCRTWTSCPHHQVRRQRALHRAGGGHGLDGGPRGVQRRARSRVSGDSARHLDREVDFKAVIPQPGRTGPRHVRSATRDDIEKLADLLVNAERPAILYGQQVWTARGHNEAIALLRGLDIPGYFNGASRGLLPPEIRIISTGRAPRHLPTPTCS